MRADIQKKCNPFFNVNNNVLKKDKLKDITPEVQDFFKQIFIVDSKKRITFSNIVKHPLFQKYRQEFSENAAFYSQHEKKEQYRKDQLENNGDYGFESDMEAEDESRTFMLKKKQVEHGVKHL